MKYLINIFVVLSLVGCSSLKKTLIYTSLAGGIAGASAGMLLSPDKKSKGANVAVFGLIGAGVAALTGYALYKDDPRNYKLKNMLRDKKELDPNLIELGLGDLKIDANLERKKIYKVPVTDLPNALVGKVNKQYLIKYQSKERHIKKGHKTYYVPAFDIYEHSYDEGLGGRGE